MPSFRPAEVCPLIHDRCPPCGAQTVHDGVVDDVSGVRRSDEQGGELQQFLRVAPVDRVKGLLWLRRPSLYRNHIHMMPPTRQAGDRLFATPHNRTNQTRNPEPQPARASGGSALDANSGLVRVLIALGLALVVVGVIWLGQGVALIGGSFMTGEAVWAVIGGSCICLGGLLVRAGFRWRQAISVEDDDD